MKKLAFYFIFLIPILALSQTPPPPGLPDEPAIVPIDSMLFLLFTAGVVFGSYTIFKKK
ncbi:hypothetical protein D3C85_1392090 [compost metagenome]